MGDWADEVVKSLHPMWTMTHAAPRIAADLRKARADALEEAARECEPKGDAAWSYQWRDAGQHIAAAIRALKDKPACG